MKTAEEIRKNVRKETKNLNIAEKFSWLITKFEKYVVPSFSTRPQEPLKRTRSYRLLRITGGETCLQNLKEGLAKNAQNLKKELDKSAKKRSLYTVDISVLKHWTNEKPLPLEKLEEIKKQWGNDDWDGLYDPPYWLTAEMFSIALMDLESNDLKCQKLVVAAKNLKIARLTLSSNKNCVMKHSVKDKTLQEVVMKLYDNYKYAVNIPFKIFLSKFKDTKKVFLMTVEVDDSGIELERKTMEIAKDIHFGITSNDQWENAKLKYLEASLDDL